METTILNQRLHPTLKALGLKQGVLNAFGADATVDGNSRASNPSSFGSR